MSIQNLSTGGWVALGLTIIQALAFIQEYPEKVRNRWRPTLLGISITVTLWGVSNG